MKKLLISISILSIFTIFSCGDSTEEPTIQTTVDVSPFVGSIDEGVAAGTFIGTVEGSTNQGIVSYSLSNIKPPGAIVISETIGDISVSDALVFNFETNEQITATVTVSNDGVSAEAPVTININDIDESEPKVIWSGNTITFTKPAGADPSDESNQDRITENVWITRGNNGGQIYNVKTESRSTKEVSPEGTEWAIGSIDNVDDLEFKPFRETLVKPKDQLNVDLVVHLISDDIYLSLKFTSWDIEKTGGLSYERSSK